MKNPDAVLDSQGTAQQGSNMFNNQNQQMVTNAIASRAYG